MANVKELLKTYWLEGLLIIVGTALLFAGSKLEEGKLLLLCPGAVAAWFGAMRIIGHRIAVQEKKEARELLATVSSIYQDGYYAGQRDTSKTD